MHKHASVTAGALLAAGILLVGCDPSGANTSSSPGTSVTTTVNAGSSVPNFVGMGLQAAQDAAQAKGFDNLTSHDASGGGRHQIFDRNWTVCDQTPAAGSRVDDGTEIDMGAVKTDETCPEDAATASTSPAPTTTSPSPKPKPKAIHHPATQPASTHKAVGDSSSGSEDSSSSGGSDYEYTQPPADDHGGASALCNDGTLSYAAHHQGACSHHHGVAEFYN